MKRRKYLQKHRKITFFFLLPDCLNILAFYSQKKFKMQIKQLSSNVSFKGNQKIGFARHISECIVFILRIHFLYNCQYSILIKNPEDRRFKSKHMFKIWVDLSLKIYFFNEYAYFIITFIHDWRHKNCIYFHEKLYS